MNFFKDRMSGKGTAAVICFCLAAAAALGIFSYNRSAEQLKNELSGLSEVTVTEPAAEDVNAPAEVPFTEADKIQENIILEHDAFGGEETAAETDAAETVTEPLPVPAASFEEGMSDAIVSPVSGEVINSFSNGELVKSKTLSVWKTHDGIDVAAEQTAAVRSMTSGVVTQVLKDPMMGVTVVIDHGSGYEGWYCNLGAETMVSEGDTVAAGTVIGEVGSTAEAEIAEPSHLHFGVKKNGRWSDPADLLSGEGS